MNKKRDEKEEKNQKRGKMKPQFYKKKLKNGLTVLFEKRELPVISVGLACKFGSAYETEEEKGTAHFIEHMLFKGTKKRKSKQIVDEITGKGGEYNAFTAKTFTAAWLK
ncbi:MAG TPA: insulinase family protein, partial [Candidatus Paceibacterota bacterium]|nr:insulinase family protein [Candidatus Paceibacterota bacterium]